MTSQGHSPVDHHITNKHATRKSTAVIDTPIDPCSLRTTYGDFLGVGRRHVDDVWHLLEQLFGLP